MAGVQEQIQAITKGQAVSITDRIDIAPGEDMQFIPVTKKNMCYICCCILFDESGGVLMIQEAKASCRGKWYLPAGRLEPHETLEDGTKREVLEESGLKCELTSLIGVEVNTTWQRYTFTGTVTGGKLKTTNKQDDESLQAKFFSQAELVAMKSSIRAEDVYKLVDVGRKYLAREASLQCRILPVVAPHKHCVHRIVILDRSSSNNSKMHALSSNKGGQHIPSCVMIQRQQASIAVSVYAVLKDALADNNTAGSVRLCGVLGVEHRGTGTQEDGVCITSLICLDLGASSPPPSPASGSYKWLPITDLSLEAYLTKASNDRHGSLVPVI